MKEYDVNNFARYLIKEYFGYTTDIIPSYFFDQLQKIKDINPFVLRKLFKRKADYFKSALAKREFSADYFKLAYLLTMVKNLAPEMEKELTYVNKMKSIERRKGEYVTEENDFIDTTVPPKDISKYLDEGDLL